jgi:dCMP deaminase
MKEKFVNFFMSIAEQAATLSYADRKKVGCVIAKDRNILSFGYNGMPAGWDNTCEDIVFDTAEDSKATNEFPFLDANLGKFYKKVTKPQVSHAEENAIAKLATSTQSSDGATAFVTLAPCLPCAKLMKNAGITTLIYKDAYADEGIVFLKQCGVEVSQWQKPENGSPVKVVTPNLEL